MSRATRSAQAWAWRAVLMMSQRCARWSGSKDLLAGVVALYAVAMAGLLLAWVLSEAGVLSASDLLATAAEPLVGAWSKEPAFWEPGQSVADDALGVLGMMLVLGLLAGLIALNRLSRMFRFGAAWSAPKAQEAEARAIATRERSEMEDELSGSIEKRKSKQALRL